MTTIHAPGFQGGGEFTLCGDSFDAFETGDAEEPVLFAKPLESGSGRKSLVTCEACRIAIDFVRQNFSGYRYKPKED